ncbi:glycoside hydrolase family 15 protein [Streptomyces sp. NPDC002623]
MGHGSGTARRTDRRRAAGGLRGALTRTDDLAHRAGYDGRLGLAALLDWLTEHWDRPDEGIWETRGGRQHFTCSRLMCWTAFDHVSLDEELIRQSPGWGGSSAVSSAPGSSRVPGGGRTSSTSVSPPP